MAYYDEIENVLGYIEMAKDCEATMLVDILKEHLESGSSVLELGMGPGNDFKLLEKNYKVTGTDKFEHFINLYKVKNDEADVFVLDAVTLETDRKFDCIYSNKVLMHLTKEELNESFKKQWEMLNEGGLVFHTFWKGDGKEYNGDMLNQYYSEKLLSYEVDSRFEIILLAHYEEFEENDSIILIAKK